MVTRSAFSLLISFLISISAAAGTDVLLFVQGGMGSDGASLQPYPNKNSVKLAEEIYRALKVTPAADGSKSVGFLYDGDLIGLKCEQPKTGIHTKTGGCEITLVVKGPAPRNGLSFEKSGEIEFPPVVSENLFNALKFNQDSERRIGAVVKGAGNLRCSRAVRPGVKPRCMMTGLSLSKMSIDQFSQDQQEGLKEVAKLSGLNN